MKKMVILLLIVNIALVFAQSKTLRQMVLDWPVGYDTTGVDWVVYYIHNADDSVLYDTSINSFTLYSAVTNRARWSIDCVDFGTPGMNEWSPGDSILAFGSWDSAFAANPGTYGSNPNHVGFYWLFSDTLTSEDIQTWVDDDTLRPIPKPIVTMTGPGGWANDTIWITIPNPEETRRPDQSGVYDVLGYWLFADTTTAGGTPNAYDAVTAMDFGFIAVQGVYGENTVYWMLESDGFEAWSTWTTYFAYKLVARPDTLTGPDIMGHATYYFSQNSDPIDVYQNVVGIKENTQPRVQQINLQALPSIFCENTRIVFSITKSAWVKLVVYNTSGQIIRTLVNDVKPAGEHHIEFDGTDTQGIELPAGIYFYQLQTAEQQLTGRLTKLR